MHMLQLAYVKLVDKKGNTTVYDPRIQEVV